MEQNLYRRAAVLVELKKYNEAGLALQALLEQEPLNAEALELFSEVKLQAGETEAALNIITTAIGLRPENDRLFHQRSRIYYKKNDFNAAASDIKAALALNPRLAAHFALFALISIYRGNYKTALEIADKALQLDPLNTIAINARHMAYERLNYRDEAENTILHALSIDPENELSHANKGWSLLEQKKPREALAHFREALRIHPSYNYALAGIKIAISEQTQPYRAIRAYVNWLQSPTALNRNLRTLFFLLPLVSIIFFRLKNDRIIPYETLLLFTHLVVLSLDVLYPPIALLSMRFHSDGKHLLTKKENIIALITGGCLIFGLAGLLCYLVILIPAMLKIYITSISLLLPLASYTKLNKSKIKDNIQAVIAAGMAAILLIAAIITTSIWRDGTNLFYTFYFIWAICLNITAPKEYR
ncbi:tetratricopeptide repeat protein [Chitinophaga sp. YIM B06452]|uniref:tetratricopeptide repeat protein n=1 Tax=Chitinophaga sp. YIM B06452 TaxID=3082158 RepID=UPI0031FEB087